MMPTPRQGQQTRELPAESRIVATSWEVMASPVPLSFNLHPDNEDTLSRTLQPLHSRAQVGRFTNGNSDLDENNDWTTSSQHIGSLNNYQRPSDSSNTSISLQDNHTNISPHNNTSNRDYVNINQDESNTNTQILTLEHRSDNDEHQGNIIHVATRNNDENISNTTEPNIIRLETIRDVSEVDDSPTHDVSGGASAGLIGNRETSNSTVYEDSTDSTEQRQAMVPDYTNELNQKTLLDLMTRGFRTFTCEMADVVIDKLNPEYETLARKVGEEVKQSTAKELKELKELVDQLKSKLHDKESENIQLKGSLEKEKLKAKLEIEKEVLKREKLTSEQSDTIESLKTQLEKLQSTKSEREKWVKKAELKAKSEERKRIQIEEDYNAKLKDLHKQLDRVKGDLLVKKSVKRIKASSAKDTRSGAITRLLVSHHGHNRNRSTTYVHLPYQEGDP